MSGGRLTPANPPRPYTPETHLSIIPPSEPESLPVIPDSDRECVGVPFTLSGVEEPAPAKAGGRPNGTGRGVPSPPRRGDRRVALGWGAAHTGQPIAYASPQKPCRETLDSYDCRAKLSAVRTIIPQQKEEPKTQGSPRDPTPRMSSPRNRGTQRSSPSQDLSPPVGANRPVALPCEANRLRLKRTACPRTVGGRHLLTMGPVPLP